MASAAAVHAAEQASGCGRLAAPYRDLSVIILADDGTRAVDELVTGVHAALAPLGIDYEIVVAAPAGRADERQALWVHPGRPGYSAALEACLARAAGEYLVTLPGDNSASPSLVRELWEARQSADMVIASRYVPGGRALVPVVHLVLSRWINYILSRGLDLRVQDISSSARLVARNVAEQTWHAGHSDYGILAGSVVRALAEGYRVREIPFVYRPRQLELSRARMLRLCLDFARTFAQLWRLRNSIASADYDDRAFGTWLVPQRYWQRQRYRHVIELVRDHGTCLDVGCGSSRIIAALPPGSVALDILMRKLRYARRYEKTLVHGSALALPFGPASFPCVLCSEVIEHIPRCEAIFDELDRVLQPGGRLILGTPDYGGWSWPLIESGYRVLLPQAYADEHITHYSRAQLLEEFVERRRYTLEAVRYILRGELILAVRKPGAPAAAHRPGRP